VIEIVAHSEAMREAIRLADRVAETDANVLITGESGVGKDALAFYVHS
jgi:transcriptional regulator with PAS, ATPase and Fis domain